jgi:nicotinamidase/pyrazinamidase
MRVLLLIDVQTDFAPGGALPVAEANCIVPIANALQLKFPLVVATQDWHPLNHLSFAINHPGKRPGETVELAGAPQILWPVHCVQGTTGAAFLPDLDIHRIQKVIQKGTDPVIDSYSGFYDNAQRRDTGLGDYLRQQKVDHIYLMGLATDYCVKFTALDALRLGFRVTLIRDGCRGVELNPGDVIRAINDVQTAGAQIVSSDSLGVKDVLEAGACSPEA